MKYFALATVALSLLVLQSCSSGPTPYQSLGSTGGYSNTQLDENVFKVSFRGNGSTRLERAIDFTLLRCAELTLQNGYKYFVVVDKSNRNPVTDSGTTYTETDYATSKSTYYIRKPRTSNVIVMHKERPETTLGYNARMVYDGIRKKYAVETKK